MSWDVGAEEAAGSHVGARAGEARRCVSPAGAPGLGEGGSRSTVAAAAAESLPGQACLSPSHR